MAIRNLLRAAETGSQHAMARVFDNNSGPKVMGFRKPADAPPVEDLPDPSEFAAGEVE